jgi:hypothetical protein
MVIRPRSVLRYLTIGAIPPNDAFQYVFRNGADRVLAGTFDFEIAEDVPIVNDVLANVQNKTRPWRS